MKNDKMVRFLKNIMVLIAVLPLLGSCIREDKVANSPQGNFEDLIALKHPAGNIRISNIYG